MSFSIVSLHAARLTDEVTSMNTSDIDGLNFVISLFVTGGKDKTLLSSLSKQG